MDTRSAAFDRHALKRLREGKGLSQNQLAEAIGVRQASISAWEQGESEPNLSNVAALGRFFGLSITFFLARQLAGE